ncbi:MAG: glycolate oxidase iron-sulfur subunit [Limisphaerales bacterium]|jgi:glycolate oxidase iron-sulfur subunit
MRTDFDADFLTTPEGSRANEILRSCVHCGFCNATCPTYQVTGDELDGPRGRIYLMRDLLQSGDNEKRATQHLDRCLTCRACEVTCPSGVEYGELIEIARNQLGSERTGIVGLLRRLLAWMVPNVDVLRFMARIGGLFSWLLPSRLSKLVPASVGRPVSSSPGEQGQVLLLNGCAQQVSTPDTNVSVQQLLTRLGVGSVVLEDEGCCGSLDLHAGSEQTAKMRIKQNIDRIAPHLDDVECVLSSASGCGLTMKEWGRVLAQDEAYAEKAAAISAKVRDVSEYLLERAAGFTPTKVEDIQRVAWHAPCTLQHGQKITGVVEPLLLAAGYELVEVHDAHLCCGSAGSYSALEPKLAGALEKRKLAALLANKPDVIATANVGCQSHLNTNSSVPVVHWIELLK